MERKKLSTILTTALLLVGSLAFADKTEVKIEAPDTAKKGTEVTVKIHVNHSGNNFMHYTNLVEVKINGKQYKKWKYSAFSKPEDEKFTLSFKIKIEQDTVIEAKGNCNMHGSRGKAEHRIKAI